MTEPVLSATPARSALWTRVGIGTMAVSLLLWALLPVIPFLPLAGARKTVFGVGVFVAAEVAFWLAVVLLGKQVVERYLNRLNPFRPNRATHTTSVVDTLSADKEPNNQQER